MGPGEDPADAGVVYDPALQAWVDTALDATNRMLCATTTHLSVFASAFKEFALATPADLTAPGDREGRPG